MGRIGAAIASGQGFSNPFGSQTGPTAWESPLYPYLIAGVFRIFGIYSRSSAFVLLSMNSLFSALTCIPIFLIARRIFSEKVAVGAAWTWALLPLRNVLVHTLGMGDEPVRPAADHNLLARAHHGRSRRDLMPWLRVRTALGRRRVDQHGASVVPAGLGAMGLVPSRPARPAVVCRRSSGFGRFLRLHHSLAAAQLSNVWAGSFSSATTLGRNCDWETAMAPTEPGCRICIPRRMCMPCGSTRPWANCPTSRCASGKRWITSMPTTRGSLGCALSASSTIGPDRRGWRKPGGWRRSRIPLPRFFGADVLGIRSRASAAEARSMAFVLADFVISGGVLHRLSQPALPASD